MNWKFICITAVLYANTSKAQLYISPGAQLSLGGNAQMVIENMDLVNNGSLLAGASTISFSGNAASLITGNQPLQLYSIDINKASVSSLVLQKSISVQQTIHFSAGFLNLNGFDVDLGNTGSLTGEQENTRVIGDNGGRLLLTSVLNAPGAVNPGNLGAVITSPQNLGLTVIRRGHSSQVNAYNNGSSIRRYYEILPANNAGLNATLRLNYLVQELNGFDENNLFFWKTNGSSWQNLGFNTRNTSLHFAEKTGIDNFSKFTLSSANNALPLQYVLFNTSCNNGNAQLIWKTAQEINTQQFVVERSDNGITFQAVATLAAAGNSATEKTYSYTDNNILPGAIFYRVLETDLDGKKNYSSISKLTCGDMRNGASVWPNPVTQAAFLSINALQPSTAIARVFNNQGGLVYTGHYAILKGSNQLQIDMSRFATGLYTIEVVWNGRNSREHLQLIKQ